LQRSSERILTTHVGRLSHAPELNRALMAGADGRRTEGAEFQAELRRRVAEAIDYQRRLGLDLVNDGELGKLGWQAYAHQRLRGFRLAREGDPVTHSLQATQDWRDFEAYYTDTADSWRASRWEAARSHRLLVCDGPIAYAGMGAVAQDIENLLGALQAAGLQPGDGFMNATSPGSILATNLHYADEQDYLQALAGALHEEYAAITGAGLTLQIDDPVIVDQEVDYTSQSGLRAYYEWAELRVSALNAALRGIPRDQIRVHICWGSWRGPHSTDLPMKYAIPLLLKMHVGGFAIEAANARHEHEFDAWRGAELEGRVLMPGVVGHATDTVEHPELVAMRIGFWAEAVGREQVIASSDCGLGDRVHPQIEQAKLAALVEGARISSDRLWHPSATPRRRGWRSGATTT
jgi:5-methyltetrahydropteroyltriglutamate--homocysteine methyltransferase